jgi:hypothetical protein
MSTPREFTNREIKAILTTIHGDRPIDTDMGKLEKKILWLYPQIKRELEEEERIRLEAIELEEKRDAMVIAIYDKDIEHPTVENTVKWYVDHMKMLDDNNMDVVYFATSLFKFIPKIKQDELNKSIIEATTPDDELKEMKGQLNVFGNYWLTLTSLIDDATEKRNVKPRRTDDW